MSTDATAARLEALLVAWEQSLRDVAAIFATDDLTRAAFVERMGQAADRLRAALSAAPPAPDSDATARVVDTLTDLATALDEVAAVYDGRPPPSAPPLLPGATRDWYCENFLRRRILDALGHDDD